MQRTARSGPRKRPAASPGAAANGAEERAELRPKDSRTATAATGSGKVLPKGHAAERSEGAGRAASEDSRELLRQLIARANDGDREALARLRQFLDLNPALWARAGDLTEAAERAWIELVVGTDQFAAESVRRRVAQLKAELQGPSPTRLEALLIDQISLTWLAAQHGEIQAASPAGGSLQQAAFRLRRAESAQRRHLTAIKTLATLRSLSPAGLVPTRSIRLHDPDQKLG
jgi:hypothetical protein